MKITELKLNALVVVDDTDWIYTHFTTMAEKLGVIDTWVKSEMPEKGNLYTIINYDLHPQSSEKDIVVAIREMNGLKCYLISFKALSFADNAYIREGEFSTI